MTTLELAHEELLSHFGARELRGALEVILYPQESFREIMSHGPHWLGGVFDGRIRIPVPIAGAMSGEVPEKLKVTLRHELVHAVFFDMSSHRNLPSWFNEGFAQYFSCLGRDCQLGSTLASKAKFFDLRDFEGSFASFSQAKAGLIYRQSLYMIEFLERQVDSTGLLTMIEAIGPQSRIDSDSLLRPLGLSFSTLHARAKSSWEQELGFE